MNRLFFLFLIILTLSCEKKQDPWIISTPARNLYAVKDPDGTTVIPNGRLIRPAGRTFETAPHPFGLALSPDGNIAVTANSGTSPLSISIIRNLKQENPEIQQVPPGPYTDKGVLGSVFMGLAISPDNTTVYVSGGQENKIYVLDLKTGGKID